jgi:hypothetical protein
MALPLFTSSLQDALAKLARREYTSEEERNSLLKTVFESQNIKPKDAVWMAFRPEKFLRDASVRVLRRLRTTETAGVFVAESRDKNEASLRVATEILFGLRIPRIEDYLMQLLNAEDEAVREATRRLVMAAPASKSLEALFWKLVETGQPDDRAIFLERLATLEVNASALTRWTELAADNQPQVRAVALRFLADNCPQAAIDQIVDNLPRVDYATQQHLIDALAKVVKEGGARLRRPAAAVDGLRGSGNQIRGPQGPPHLRRPPRSGQTLPQVFEKSGRMGAGSCARFDARVRAMISWNPPSSF